MLKFAFVDSKGEIKNICHPSDRGMFIEDVEYHGLIAKEIPFEWDDLETLKTKYLKDGVFKGRPLPPEFSYWDSAAEQWMEDIAGSKRAKLDELKMAYGQVCAGIDPATQKQIYVDCVVGETTYRMNAGRQASETLFFALQKAQQKGIQEYFLVDFYDEIHQGVPMSDCFAVNMQQGDDAEVHYITKQGLKAAIGSAETVAQLREIQLTFPVNVII
jgi:hypothetical protein